MTCFRRPAQNRITRSNLRCERRINSRSLHEIVSWMTTVGSVQQNRSMRWQCKPGNADAANPGGLLWLKRRRGCCRSHFRLRRVACATTAPCMLTDITPLQSTNQWRKRNQKTYKYSRRGERRCSSTFVAPGFVNVMLLRERR